MIWFILGGLSAIYVLGVILIQIDFREPVSANERVTARLLWPILVAYGFLRVLDGTAKFRRPKK